MSVKAYSRTTPSRPRPKPRPKPRPMTGLLKPMPDKAADSYPRGQGLSPKDLISVDSHIAYRYFDTEATAEPHLSEFAEKEKSE